MKEPVFSTIPSGIEMDEAFNYYAENYSWKDSEKFTIAFLKKRKLDKLTNYITKMEDNERSWVSGWICRMIDNGSKVTKDSIKYLEMFLKKVEEKC